MMLTEFGKICRKIRIDHGELMRHMAFKLDVTASFLSAVENGKRNIPKKWCLIIIEMYGLNCDEGKKLREATQPILERKFKILEEENERLKEILHTMFNPLDVNRICRFCKSQGHLNNCEYLRIINSRKNPVF